MSKISGKETKPEIKVRKYLFSKGFRYRKNDKRFVGKPDIVLPKYKTVVFVHGCFWHGHDGCKKAALPQNNHEFWANKIQGNIKRDKINQQTLQDLGWQIITIWQCQIKNKTEFDETMKKVADKITAETFSRKVADDEHRK